MAEITYLQAIRDALWEEMERDEDVFLVGEDIGVYGGAFKVTRGFLEHFGEDRIIDTPIAEAGIIVDMIIQNTRAEGQTDLTFTVPKVEFKRALELEKKIAADIGAEEVFGDENIAKVSVIGVGMKDNSGVASTMFRTLSEENINITMISTSEIRISCVIEEKYAELAVRVLHTAFGLDRDV